MTVIGAVSAQIAEKVDKCGTGAVYTFDGGKTGDVGFKDFRQTAEAFDERMCNIICVYTWKCVKEKQLKKLMLLKSLCTCLKKA